MANEKRLIKVCDATAVYNGIALYMAENAYLNDTALDVLKMVAKWLDEAPTVDAVEVVRCQNCVHAEPLDHNCELSTSFYMHCKLWRGEEAKNVWHRYKKYYKDYSLIERSGYCDAGAKM